MADSIHLARKTDEGKNVQRFLFTPGTGGPVQSTSYGAYGVASLQQVGAFVPLEGQRWPIPALETCGRCERCPQGIAIDCILREDMSPSYTECSMSGRHYLLRRYQSGPLAGDPGFVAFADQSVVDEFPPLIPKAPPCEWTEVACIPQWKWNLETNTPELLTNPPMINSKVITQTGVDDRLWSDYWRNWMTLYGPRLALDFGYNRYIYEKIPALSEEDEDGIERFQILDHRWIVTSRGLHWKVPLATPATPEDAEAIPFDSEGHFCWQLVNQSIPYHLNQAGIPQINTHLKYSCCGVNYWGDTTSVQGIGTFTNHIEFPNPDTHGFPYGSFGSQYQVLTTKGCLQ